MISRFQFVDDHRDTYEVKRLCQVLDVNRSSYYKWLAGAEAWATRQRLGRTWARPAPEEVCGIGFVAPRGAQVLRGF